MSNANEWEPSIYQQRVLAEALMLFNEVSGLVHTADAAYPGTYTLTSLNNKGYVMGRTSLRFDYSSSDDREVLHLFGTTEGMWMMGVNRKLQDKIIDKIHQVMGEGSRTMSGAIHLDPSF